MIHILKRLLGIAFFPLKEWEIIKNENENRKLLFYFSFIAVFEILWQLLCSQFNLLSYSFEKEVVLKFLSKDMLNVALIIAASAYIFVIFLLFSERIRFIDSFKLVLYPLGLRPIMLLFGLFPIFSRFLIIFSIYQLIILGFGIYAYIQRKGKSIIVFLVIVLLVPVIFLLPALMDYLLNTFLYLFF